MHNMHMHMHMHARAQAGGGASRAARDLDGRAAADGGAACRLVVARAVRLTAGRGLTGEAACEGEDVGTPYILVWAVRDPASRNRVACESCSA